ncbi:MAG: cell surface protein SprA, partial [Bacteroidales bacterium]|nr:cell surface protein SprA [Bacteroidales bacterium]
GTTVSPSFPYVEYQGSNKITVLGVPSISDVKAILIGVRNPKQNLLTSSNDDGDPKSTEIWVNELRLSDFNKKGGWAATARVAANLADLGRIVLSGNYSTPGFGSIEKKINETQKETISQFDISTDLELGKFFPENTGIRIPLHFDYSELRSNPEYNPLDPDIKLKEDIKSYNLEDKQDSIKKITQDYVQRKNINFINVRKDRTGSARKARVYDFENFDFTYAYSEIYMRNIDVEFDLQKNYSGGFGYNFTTNPKNIKPFNKSKFLSKSGYFALIKDFNFYYLPKALSFRTDMNRLHNSKKYRNKSKGLIPMKTFYVKTWDWNRNYSLKFDLAQSLSLEYLA